MADREHLYQIEVEWRGNLGSGTSAYRAYSRDHEIRVANRGPIPGSSDPSFHGDPNRYNPEELLLAALSACHMLSYLHLCSEARIVVLAYRDAADGTMTHSPGGAGRFREVILHPLVSLAAGSDSAHAVELHERAHQLCFIANSVNFPVLCQPTVQLAGA